MPASAQAPLDEELRWHGRHNVSIDRVLDPEVLNDRDAIIRMTITAIRGSDLHL